MRIRLTMFLPWPGFDFKTGNGSYSQSKNVPSPVIFHLGYLRQLRREKRLRYELSYTWADFDLIKFMENSNEMTSIKVKFAWKKLKIQEKIFPIYINYLNRFLWR
ncbi:hypothetical protein A5884_003531 [Enterococcus sp. 7D2_DIV0200]|nr:hypothetical protein A5884_003531 [Enterococcus sp. 7D2_DIV0200]